MIVMMAVTVAGQRMQEKQGELLPLGHLGFWSEMPVLAYSLELDPEIQPSSASLLELTSTCGHVGQSCSKHVTDSFLPQLSAPETILVTNPPPQNMSLLSDPCCLILQPSYSGKQP